MFWRLFATYLLLVLTAVGLVGVLIFRRHGTLLFEMADDVAVTGALVVLLAAVPAWVMARRFARPLGELTAGARRLAEGDLGHVIRVSGGREHAGVAAALNTMSGRVADTFDQLAHDREQLRAILSGMVEGVVAIDPDQRVGFANERAGVLLEFDPAAAVGRRLWEVVRQRGFQEIVDQGLAAADEHRAELDWKGPVGRSLTVYVSRLPAPAAAGAVVVVHDTTELRRLERLRQEFVANVSHELKTPLAVIGSTVEALQDGAADDAETRDVFLARVADEAARLMALITDLLSLARIESAGQVLAAVPVRLDRAIAECLERLSARAEEKSLTLVEKPPADGPAGVEALADAGALRQVLDNLVDNAIKYTPDGGRITVRWSAAGGQAWFEVEDTGIGIGPADLPRVFERFYRADKARSRDAGGTGLGLAIVKHLVQAMRGTVRAASRPGKGTTFRVALPRPG
ncbi:sensor histidine kinase [Urbifossiella limnaea]|uniref:histidine kinase n=1 Tax=Urbifossiella limnaea TaxID=2528023 RepID=A0A517XP18_9BACT|nr:HAMP domain-containing sensor histidine kinase [Urbifossiella limnaea]QDU19248.1 Alkaline phosphatase synthesis sensor protein PhoR [Urbifossiella limnaea]